MVPSLTCAMESGNVIRRQDVKCPLNDGRPETSFRDIEVVIGIGTLAELMSDKGLHANWEPRAAISISPFLIEKPQSYLYSPPLFFSFLFQMTCRLSEQIEMKNGLLDLSQYRIQVNFGANH